MAVLLAYTMPDGSTGNIYLDASINENHQANAQVTEHKIESGKSVTDYIRPLPRRLTIEGIVTNTPIAAPNANDSASKGVTAQTGQYSAEVQAGYLQAPYFGGSQQINWQALMFSTKFDRVKDTYGILVPAALAGALFVITTSLEQIKNMAIENFAAPRNVENSNALRFTIDFKEIIIVDTSTMDAQPSKIKSTKLGNKAPKAANATQQAQTQKSMAATFSDAHGGLGSP